ncbi:tripartite tricarboxylate transporter TctB family protein [Falsigemmobacter intermedius]|uniref:tripartite tricarboxylate transporter TctB family protein n=1 Tax=Falsigemmobacter intermedius TaxID=1553448 RepID=UPI003EFFB012
MGKVHLSAAATRRGAALLFLVVSAGAIRESLRLQALSGADAVGSGAFPGLAALALGLAALVLLSGWRDQGIAFEVSQPLRVLAALLAMIAFVAALGQAPILPVIAAFVALFQALLGERRLPVIFGGAAAVTLAIQVMFGLLLNVPF